ncbi:probable protein S-acyltransferase 22 isoform X2 [Pomacea canaliculata]|uniref:probable protein S-acyltransferase 22 isoform X2 n=1 Tax=Pomacea canaliculata TaxID=400727 RepID=UPI000D72DB14|nr:probable protein S-acyltransferase 22 isoform X2 [Pomacea canaliculata]
MATTINPADPAIVSKRSTKTASRLSRSKHAHAIQNQHCYLCEVDVGPKSKHCRACNKCVSDFDHHCKWLNNCVGGRNYRWFLASLVMGTCGTLLVVVVGLTQFISFFVDKQNGKVLMPYIVLRKEGRSNDTADFRILNQQVTGEGWLILTGITTLLAAVTLALLVHLLFFHFWLMYKGLTTYEYIVMLREKDGYHDADGQKQTSTSNARPSLSIKANKVTPSKNPLDGKESEDCSRSEKELVEYHHALEQACQTGGETPPPSSSPLHWGEGKGVETTAVRKLKKKKRKQSTEIAGHQNVSTFGDNTLYTYPEKKDNSLANPLKQDQRSAAPRNKTTRRPLPQPMGEHGDLITEITPSTRSSADNYKKKKQLDPLGIEASENINLNSTMMFTLNSSAKLMADGSLDYSSQDAFRSLPLTPVPFRRRADVPPLDLTALRSSTDSLMSSNTFQPYSGTVRSTDTYRVNERQSYQLQSVPEGNMDAII